MSYHPLQLLGMDGLLTRAIEKKKYQHEEGARRAPINQPEAQTIRHGPFRSIFSMAARMAAKPRSPVAVVSTFWMRVGSPGSGIPQRNRQTPWSSGPSSDWNST